jgi:zinc protease
MLLAACGTRNDAALLALREVLRHLEGIRSAPVLDPELALSKDSIANSFVFRYQTPDQIISQRAQLEFLGYPADWLDAYLGKVQSVTKAAVLEAGRARLRPDASLIVVVGPSELAGPLEEFGPVEVRRPD